MEECGGDSCVGGRQPDLDKLGEGPQELDVEHAWLSDSNGGQRDFRPEIPGIEQTALGKDHVLEQENSGLTLYIHNEGLRGLR